MIEKARIFICQLVTSTLFVILIVWAAFNIIVNTDLNNRLSIIGLNYEFLESVAIGLLLAHFAVLSMILVVWLMRWPKTNYTKRRRGKAQKRARQIDMGTIKMKNIPQNAR